MTPITAYAWLFGSYGFCVVAAILLPSKPASAIFQLWGRLGSVSRVTPIIVTTINA
jgi:hypothetical protein